MGQCYWHVILQQKIKWPSDEGYQSSVLWNCGCCNLVEECWLWWLPGWESCLYCFLRDTNTLALIVIELCTQWLAGMLRFLRAAARDKSVSHPETDNRNTPFTLSRNFNKGTKKCHSCAGLCVFKCTMVTSCVFSNPDITSCSGVSNKIKTILCCCLSWCHSTKNMSWNTHSHTHIRTQTRLFHWPQQTPFRHTPHTERRVLPSSHQRSFYDPPLELPLLLLLGGGF